MFSDQTSVLSGSRDHVIDLNAPPHEPEGLKAVQHLQYEEIGLFTWHPPAVNLSREDDQLATNGLSALTLRNRLLRRSGVRIFNANLLDFLATRTEIIPVEQTRVDDPEIAFFGTQYEDRLGNRYVRTIRRVDGVWVQSMLPLSASCCRRYYAALWNRNWLDKVSLN